MVLPDIFHKDGNLDEDALRENNRRRHLARLKYRDNPHDANPKFDSEDALGWLLAIGLFSIPVWLILGLGWLEKYSKGSAFVFVTALFIVPFVYFILKCIWTIMRGR